MLDLKWLASSAMGSAFFWPIAYFVFGLVLAFVLAPLVIHLALKARIVAVRDLRRRHDQDTPLLGGAIIYSSLAVASGLIYFSRGRSPASDTPGVVWFLFPLTLVFFLGAWDDCKRLTAYPKFFVQTLAAVIFLLSKYSLIQSFGLPLPLFPLVYVVLTVTMVGIMNSVNLIDGMDGLCSGSTAISAVFAILIAASMGMHSYLFSCLAPMLVGACLAFLWHNWKPAKIFLGDSGSLTIGFFLAAAVVEITLSHQSLMGLLVGLVLVAHPVLDTMTVMYSRARAGRPIFSGDRNHFHHRLQRLGLKQENTVKFLWLSACYFGMQALFLAGAPAMRSITILVSLVLIVFLSIFWLSFTEKSLSLQLTRFGQAGLGALMPQRMDPHEFFGIIHGKISEKNGRMEGFSFLVIDYLKIMPQMIQESPSKVDEFFRRCHQLIRGGIREESLVAQLSDCITVALMENDNGSGDAAEAVYQRISKKICDLQREFGIMNSDVQVLEGISLISYPREFFDFCDQLNIQTGDFRRQFNDSAADIRILIPKTRRNEPVRQS